MRHLLRLLSIIFNDLLLACADAISIPTTALIGVNKNFSITPTNQSILAATPPLPPGFGVSYRFDTEKSIDPLSTYVIAILITWSMGERPWTGPADSQLRWTLQSPGQKIKIYVEGSSQFEVRHFLLALYRGVIKMCVRQPGFYEFDSEVSLYGSKLGSINTRRAHDVWSLSQIKNVWNSTAGFVEPAIANDPTINSTGALLTSSMGGLTASSGVVRDPDSPALSIAWTSDADFPIPSQQIFTAVLNALLTVAQYPTDAPCEFITGLSASGNVGFHISRTSPLPLTYGTIARAYFLLTTLVIARDKKFVSLGLQILLDGDRIATGCLYKIQGLQQACNAALADS